MVLYILTLKGTRHDLSSKFSFLFSIIFGMIHIFNTLSKFKSQVSSCEQDTY